MKKGKFIVLYGNNNTGKTTQVKLLAERIKKTGRNVRYFKYPIYNLKPSGLILNNYLRERNKYNLTSREAQILYTLNRMHFESTILKLLNDGMVVIAEDYTGTGIGWGMSGGVNKDFLIDINSNLLKEDLAIFLKGERFIEGKEQGHIHETDDKRLKQMQKIFDKLQREFDWKIVKANNSAEKVSNDVWKIVKNII